MKIFKADFHQVFLVLFCSVFSLFYITNPLFAYDKNILIAPTRVIFEGKTRSTVVKLINPNNKPISYKVSVGIMRMDEYGKLTEVESPNERELLTQKMIRFSPRRVTIGPKVWQTVRVMVRKPKDLPPGEYRAQLKVAQIPDSNQSNEEDTAQKKALAININYVFAISIPIIVRHGEGDVTIVANTPKLITKHDKYYLETNLERTGLYSAYFDVDAFFTPSGKTKKLEIGSCKGLTIYEKNNQQFVHVPVKNKALLTKGKIDFEIRDREKRKKPLIHSKSFEINGMKVYNE